MEKNAEKPSGADPAGDLLNEATALLKSLRSLKAVKIKLVAMAGNFDQEKMALL